MLQDFRQQVYADSYHHHANAGKRLHATDATTGKVMDIVCLLYILEEIGLPGGVVFMKFPVETSVFEVLNLMACNGCRYTETRQRHEGFLFLL